MNLRATQLHDDPVERLFAYHRRVERQLAALGRLPVHIEAHGIDPEASAIAGAVLHCFGPAFATHRDEEERDLLPLLERRIGSGEELSRFRLLRARIES